jgi:hypothetical protein
LKVRLARVEKVINQYSQECYYGIKLHNLKEYCNVIIATEQENHGQLLVVRYNNCMSPTLSNAGAELIRHLQTVEQNPEYSHYPAAEKLHVTGIGRQLYLAYEHLRNAAEYSEDHLLLRRAIERFYRRSKVLHDSRIRLDTISVDLVNELTQAGYLPNNSIPLSVIAQVGESLKWHTTLLWQLRKQRKVSHEKAVRWVVESLSVENERILKPRYKDEVFVSFTYGHFLQSIRREDFQDIPDNWHYTMEVYCAVHRTLLKSDLATVRYWLLRVSGRDFAQPDVFIELNQSVETLFQAKSTIRLMRLVRRHGAPFRVLRDVIRESNDAAGLLANRDQCLHAVSEQTQADYTQARKRLKRGIIRSIVFVFITKMIIGTGIEVPYDLAANGSIAWVPLMANLLFPPLYMASLGWSISLPDSGNAVAIKNQLNRIMYATGSPSLVYTIKKRSTSPGMTIAFNIVYTLMFLISFGLLLWALHSLHFGLVQGAIFFIFLSTVSFLGFRLSRNAHELDLVDSSPSAAGIVSDFLYTPFVRIGQWIADKYARANVITLLLDLAIELPMKSFLRILQQWVGFLKDKREEM